MTAARSARIGGAGLAVDVVALYGLCAYGSRENLGAI
jgi:hypothetical protein